VGAPQSDARRGRAFGHEWRNVFVEAGNPPARPLNTGAGRPAESTEAYLLDLNAKYMFQNWERAS